MAGYLDQYGVADERRARVIRWFAISAAILIVGGLVLYFTLRTYPAKRQVRLFLTDLTRHDYKGAYRTWGCAQGCRDYTFESFMRDWGPQSAFADASAARIEKTRYCDTGTIVTVSPQKGDSVPLWYESSNATLGFSPWPVCAPHIPAPSSAPAP